MSAKKVSILTVTYNDSQNLLDFFESLKNQTYQNIQVIIFDNNSIDNCVEVTNRLFPSAVLIRSAENIGFAKAVNICFKEAGKLGADYVFVLNNDVKFNRRCVEELVNLAESKEAVIAGPILLKWQGGENIVQEYGGEIDIYKGTKKKYFVDAEMDKIAIPEIKRVSFIGGGVSLISLSRLGERDDLFDERYFLYTEEMDLQTELKIAKSRMYVTTKAQVWHKVHNRSIKQLYRESFYITRNLYLYKYKFFGFRKAFSHFIVQLYKLPRSLFLSFRIYGLLMVWNLVAANLLGVINYKGKVKFKYLY
jgi:GT2 family glycosyltransferase